MAHPEGLQRLRALALVEGEAMADHLRDDEVPASKQHRTPAFVKYSAVENYQHSNASRIEGLLQMSQNLLPSQTRNLTTSSYGHGSRTTIHTWKEIAAVEVNAHHVSRLARSQSP